MNRFASALMMEGTWPRERLDVDYNARATVGDGFPDEMRAYRETSDEARSTWLRMADIAYDRESGQTLDIFGPETGGDGLRPAFFFIHGGYWRALSKLDSAMMAGMLAKAGIMTAVVDYRLAPDVSLSEIVREVRAALAFLWQNAERYGIDRDRIHVGGSSAGGHLTGMILSGGWHEDFDVPANVVKSALPISGLFELAPLAASFSQEWLSLDDKQVDSLSPIRHLPKLGCPIMVAWAEREAPGFKRQSAAFADAWKDLGYPIRTLEVPNRNHFDILMELRSPETVLSKALQAMIGD